MKDVAREAGVHQTTVSLSLRGHPSIPRSTRDRIRVVADRLGYRPNPLLSTLMSVRRQGRLSLRGSTLAFLTSYNTRDGWRRSANYHHLFEEMKTRAAELGYQLEAFWLMEPGMTSARMRRILLARGIRGILVCPLSSSLQSLDFDFTDFAAVALGYTLRFPKLDQVAVDYYGIMQMAIANLRERGFQRIAFFTSSDIDRRVNHLSLGAFLAERKICSRGLLEPLICGSRGQISIRDWIARKKPDAIITSVHEEYQLLHRMMADSRESVGPQLYVVDAHSATRQPGVVQSIEDQARAAVDLVTSRVERAEFGPPHRPQAILVRGSWRN